MRRVKGSVDYAAYMVLTTEEFTVALFENHGDSKLVVRAIIQNYNGVSKLKIE